MDYLMENWYLIIGGIALLTVAVMSARKWLGLPTEKQVANIKEWLLYAVTEAETALGSGTGQLKLRYVYDMALSKFAWLKYIPFETFSKWVDDALEEMRHMLATNENVKVIVEG